MNRFFLHKLFWLLCLLLSPLLFAEGDSTVVVESQVDKSEMTIGDKLNYQIKVSYPEGGHVELPSVLGNLGAFEVKDYNVSEPKKENGKISQSWNFILSTFTVGQYTLPPQVVEFYPENDTAKWTTYSEPINIVVERTTAETVKEIADITDIVSMPAPSRIWLYISLALVVLIALLLLIWILDKKKKQAAKPPRLSPNEEASKALSQLASLELLAGGNHKEYCFKLSEIIRRFLSRRFEVDALESTTEEFLELLPKLPITSAHKDMLKEFCEITDPVKFAHQSLEQNTGDKLLDNIRDVVEQNKPSPEEAKK